jgi:heterodisulfide reductase subunit A
VEKKEYPTEIDVTGEEPRVGVFICHCGINIGAYVDVPSVVEYAKTLPNVSYAEENLYTCSQDTQKKIVEKIKEHKLNRVIVASCTPRTHEPLFKETIREAGLNPHLFEMANIRDQCSWVHMKDPKAATEKAKDLTKMAVAKARLMEPLPPISLDIIQKGLVIGGGLAGMTSALAIAEQGYEVYLIEKENVLGGNLNNIYYTFKSKEIQNHLRAMIKKVEKNPHIKVYKNAKIEKIDGFVGNYKTTIKNAKTSLEIEHGIVIVATGAEESKPKEYLYGKDKRVVTQLEIEKQLASGTDFNKRTIVVIQCVGSRDDEHPYCSRICCVDAIKNTLKIKEKNPEAVIYILYRDMRTYGFIETFYEKAREEGIIFIRYDTDEKPKVKKGKDGIEIEIRDRILDETILINSDLLVLSPAIIPRDGNEELAKILKVPLNEDGFFLEAHVKLRPVDFATDGMFLAGMAHSPKSIDESISQAYAAAARACTLLSKGQVSIEPTVSSVDETKCIGCGLCVSLCPSNAIELKLKEGGKKAETISASCKGCGICGASCPQQAITMKHFRNKEITAQIEAYGEGA